MTISPGEEFRIRATPSQELQRKLAYLAAQDNDSVVTGGVRSPRTAHGSSSDKAAKTADALMMARLADPAYQAMSQRINESLDLMDEASVRALQDIEEELTELRRERERMLDQAYRDEQGRAIFMAKDGTAAYYEDGTKVADDEFATLKDKLKDKPNWDEWEAKGQRRDELLKERDLIHQHEAACEDLREAVTQGSISKEEAERREGELEEALPDRVREHFRSLRGETPDQDAGADAANDADSDLALSAEEETRHNTGLVTPPFTPG